MSRPLDPPERHAVIHSSPEIFAAKHLARANGLSMRRRRRVGPVVYTLGTKWWGPIGLVQFNDAGRLIATLIGEDLIVEPPLTELDTLMQAGQFWAEGRTLAEVDTMIVLPELPVDASPVTGPVPVPGDPAHHDILVLTLPQDAAAPLAAQDREYEQTTELFLPALTDPLSASLHTESIPIVAEVTGAFDMTPRTREIAIIEVTAALPSRASLWGRFFFGVAVVLIAFAVGTAAVLNPANGVWIGAVSVVLASLAIWIISNAIRENDQRLAALRTVGLQ